jgi:hypothetical protein
MRRSKRFEELQQVLGVTPEVYERAAPYLTTYSPEAASFFGGQLKAYSVRAEAKGAQGATFVREAIVRLEGSNPRVWSWREAARE